MDLKRINELGFEQISTWMTMVLVVSFSLWWNIIILLQCYVVFLLSTSHLAYNLDIPYIMYIIYFADIFYLLEIIFKVMFIQNKRMRKLRFSKSRGWLCILIDIISIIPLELVFSFYYIDENKTVFMYNILLQNRSLRIYRILLLESFYVLTVRTPWKYCVFVFLQYFSGSLVIGHLGACVWVNIERSKSCNFEKQNCYIWYEVNMVSLVLLNWGGDTVAFKKPGERIIVIFVVLFGFLLMYAYIFPYTLYISLQLSYRKALFYEKKERLEAFINNMIKKPDLKLKLQNYFTDFWTKSEDDSSSDNLLTNIPLALQKEIFTDIYWEAFRHCEMFRGVSRSCKRSLSLVMGTEYHPSGEVIYYKGQEKLKMMFLVQGILQVMAEENEESPLLSCSSGTVFGETSLFLYTRSQAIVKCKDYCEIQTLTMPAIARVIKDYPKDKKLIIHNFNERVLMARHTQWRKKKFVEDHRDGFVTSYFVKDCVKWLKTQWRALWEVHKRYLDMIKAKEEGTRLTQWHRPATAEIKVEFISNYLNLFVLSDAFEEKKDAVCLRTTFPWSIDPSAHFLRLWYYVTMITAFIPALFYPMCTVYMLKFPWHMYILSFVVTIIFIIDVVLKLFTATKTRHKIITNFSSVLRYKLKEPSFYFDVIAALPYQIYIILKVDFSTAKSYMIGLPLHPALFKCHVFFSLKFAPGPLFFVKTLLKNLVIYFLLLYWSAEFLQFLNVLGIFKTDEESIKKFLEVAEGRGYRAEYFLSIIRVLSMAHSIPIGNLSFDSNADLLCAFFYKYFFFAFFCYLIGDYYRSITIKMFGWKSFQILTQRITQFLHSKYFSDQIITQIIKNIMFQWEYDRADYIINRVPIIKSIPTNIGRDVYLETVVQTLQSCPLFEEEPVDLLMEIVEKSDLIAVPFGTILVSYGHVNYVLNVIHKGYCQLNSYLINDVTANLGRPIIVGPGYVFPTLSSFASTPSPISVISITDCEVIFIKMNDLINIMFKNNFLKDIIEVIKGQNLAMKLKFSKPALMKVNLKGTPDEVDERIDHKAYQKLGIYGKVMRWFWPNKNVFLKRHWLEHFELIYTINLFTMCVFWPCCFGLFVYYNYILIPFLTAQKLVIALHVCFRCYLPYYNQKGLLVTHPLYTSMHYLTNSFILDVLRLCPFFAIYHYIFADPYKKPTLYFVLGELIQFFLYLSDILAYIGYSGSLYYDKYKIEIIKLCLTIPLILNLIINIMVYVYTDWFYDTPYHVNHIELIKEHRAKNPDVLDYKNIWDIYLLMSFWIISVWNSMEYTASILIDSQLYYSYIICCAGTVINLFSCAIFCSHTIVSNIRGAIYQEKIISLTKYLKYGRADEDLIARVHAYYNYEWSKTRGENLKEICKHLPAYMHEMLWYPLYKPTFNKNHLFQDADEGFFKALAVHVTSVFFTRGSIIIFKNEVQSNIYFVHKGKCFVYDWFTVLDRGSIIGDIQQTTLMQNQVYALTHVELLKIPSYKFFRILNSSDDLEANFLYKIKKAENFVKSDVFRMSHRLRLIDSKEVITSFSLQKKVIGFEDESHFEDPENSSIRTLKILKIKQKKLHSWIIYPNSWAMKVYLFFYVTDIVLTLLFVSTFIVFGGLTEESFIIIGILDFGWLLVIIATFRVGLVDNQNGDVITHYKYIAKNYAKRFDGFFLDILALFPFELLVVLFSNGVSDADVNLISYFRMIRFIRVYNFYKYLKAMFKNLKIDTYRKCFLEISIFLINLILLTISFIFITQEPTIAASRDPFKFKSEQFYAFILGFEFVINCLTSTNLMVIELNSKGEFFFFNITVCLFLYLKGKMISEILSAMYVKNLATSYYKSQVSELESYLSKKDTSPILIKEVVNYKTNLLLFSRSEYMPSFLKKAPMCIRLSVMKDLYIQHLTSCPLFENLDKSFLSQLIARATREVYFPGQKIVEQGDVDYQMYFIHTGEVYVIDQTKDKAYVEFVVGRMQAGQYFGESQGICANKPHAFTYRGRTLVEMIVLRAENWVDLRRSFPKITQKIHEKAKKLRFV